MPLLRHEVAHVVQVVQRVESGAHGFVGAAKVVQVRGGVVPADEALTLLIHWPEVPLVHALADVHSPLAREQRVVPPKPGGGGGGTAS